MEKARLQRVKKLLETCDEADVEIAVAIVRNSEDPNKIWNKLVKYYRRKAYRWFSGSLMRSFQEAICLDLVRTGSKNLGVPNRLQYGMVLVFMNYYTEVRETFWRTKYYLEWKKKF